MQRLYNDPVQRDKPVVEGQSQLKQTAIKRITDKLFDFDNYYYYNAQTTMTNKQTVTKNTALERGIVNLVVKVSER